MYLFAQSARISACSALMFTTVIMYLTRWHPALIKSVSWARGAAYSRQRPRNFLNVELHCVLFCVDMGSDPRVCCPGA
jgi:hypothetical protein